MILLFLISDYIFNHARTKNSVQRVFRSRAGRCIVRWWNPSLCAHGPDLWNAPNVDCDGLVARQRYYWRHVNANYVPEQNQRCYAFSTKGKKSSSSVLNCVCQQGFAHVLLSTKAEKPFFGTAWTNLSNARKSGSVQHKFSFPNNNGIFNFSFYCLMFLFYSYLG